MQSTEKSTTNALRSARHVFGAGIALHRSAILRKKFAVGSLAALSLASTTFVPPTSDRPARSEASPPNVVIVVTDDQRARGSMRAMPRTRRALGRHGTRFSQAFATTPTCCPSRASIFTGRYSHNHGVLTSVSGQADLLDQTTTLQRYLWDAGYLNGMFGKFLNKWAMDEPPPYFHSWATRNNGPAKHYKGGRWNVNGRVKRVKQYSTYFLGSRMEEFLDAAETQDERPFFLYFAPHSPHAPSEPARRHRNAKVGPFPETPATQETDLSDKPAYVRESQVLRAKMVSRRQKMLRTLMSADEVIAALLKRLERSGELDNTIVFFLSDNGFMLGEHGVTGKKFPYLDSVKIPFFVRWPAGFEAGVVDDRIVATIDIAPTIFEAVGLEPAHTMDGRSLLDPENRRDRLLLEHWDRQDRVTPDWASFISERDQYVEFYLRDRLVVTEREYYDLLSDPWQLVNIFGDGDLTNDPDVTVTSLELARAINCVGTSGMNPCP